MISLEYALTKEDYINYYTYVSWDAPENNKKKASYYIRQVIPIILFIFAFYYTGIFQRSNTFILLIIGFIFLLSFLSLFNVRANTVKKAEKITNDPGNSSIFHEVSMIISETGISVKDAVMDTKFQWKAFTKKQESKAYYFLFVNSMQALIIPKRVFNNEAEKNQFEKFLAQYLSFDAEIGHMVKS